MPSDPQLLYALEEAAYYLVLIGIPALAFATPAKRKRNLLIRYSISVICVWIGLILHRELIGRPASFARADANGNDAYDGVGMNVAILCLGWIFGLICTTGALVIYLSISLTSKYLKRQKAT